MAKGKSRGESKSKSPSRGREQSRSPARKSTEAKSQERRPKTAKVEPSVTAKSIRSLENNAAPKITKLVPGAGIEIKVKALPRWQPEKVSQPQPKKSASAIKKVQPKKQEPPVKQSLPKPVFSAKAAAAQPKPIETKKVKSMPKSPPKSNAPKSKLAPATKPSRPNTAKPSTQPKDLTKPAVAKKLTSLGKLTLNSTSKDKRNPQKPPLVKKLKTDEEKGEELIKEGLIGKLAPGHERCLAPEIQRRQRPAQDQRDPWLFQKRNKQTELICRKKFAHLLPKSFGGAPAIPKLQLPAGPAVPAHISEIKRAPAVSNYSFQSSYMFS